MNIRRKIIITLSFVIAIMLVIGFSYAKFVKIEVQGNQGQNTIMGNTISSSEITEGFTVTYDEGNNFIDSDEIKPEYQDIRRFKVATNYNGIQYITIELVSVANTSSGTYNLYNCIEADYNNVTLTNVESNCTRISASSDTLPTAGNTNQLHTQAKLTLGEKGTNYYVLTTNTISSNYIFKGTILVKKYIPTLEKVILAEYTTVSDAIASTYVSSASGINFGAVNSPTNGQGLYLNVKNSGSGDIKYFRGGTYCAYTDYLAEDSSGTKCIAVGGTWTDYHCSLSDSQSACTTAGGTFYELKNNVMFGGFAWKIVRINADGSIRLIYNGTSPTARGTNAQTGKSAFKSSPYADNTYIGYMYGAAGQSTYAATHTNATNSTIKGVVDTWYSNNLSSSASKIADAGFCGDRSMRSGDLGYGTNNTYYGAYVRLITNKTPIFSCPNTDLDLYTLTTNSIGNKTLTYSIGLITADEVIYAGGTSSANYTYYLQSGVNYWTISPGYFIASVSAAYAWYVWGYGPLSSNHISSDYMGVRPAVSLKSETTITGGTGTLADPWIIAS